MLIKKYYYETYVVEAESAAHAISQVIAWFRGHTDFSEWSDFDFKSVKQRRKIKYGKRRNDDVSVLRVRSNVW